MRGLNRFYVITTITLCSAVVHKLGRHNTKTAGVERQEDSSFPADSHNAILNKMNKRSKTNRKHEQWHLE